MAELLLTEKMADFIILKFSVEFIDLANVGEIRKQYAEVEDQSVTKVIMVLDNVNFMDSSAIGWVISIHQKYKKAGGKMVLVCNNTELLSLFSLTYVDKLIEITDTFEDAKLKISQ